MTISTIEEMTSYLPATPEEFGIDDPTTPVTIDITLPISAWISLPMFIARSYTEHNDAITRMIDEFGGNALVLAAIDLAQSGMLPSDVKPTLDSMEYELALKDDAEVAMRTIVSALANMGLYRRQEDGEEENET